MKRLLAGTLVTIASLGLAASAQAAPQTFYFNCPSGTAPRLANNTTAEPSWTQTAPATSFQSGGGCAWWDPGFLVSTDYSNPSTLASLQVGGAYKGEVRKLQFTLYLMSSNPAYRALGSGITSSYHLFVDGEEVATADTVEAAATAGPQPGTYKVTYTVSGLDIKASKKDKDYSLVVDESYFDDETAWVLGASDFPSSAKTFAFADLTPEEQCEADEAFCPEGDEE